MLYRFFSSLTRSLLASEGYQGDLAVIHWETQEGGRREGRKERGREDIRKGREGGGRGRRERVREGQL